MSLIKRILKCFRPSDDVPRKIYQEPVDPPPSPLDPILEVTLEDVRLNDPRWWIRGQEDLASDYDHLQNILRLGITDDARE